MISYKGYEDIIERIYENKQDHVFENWDTLSDDEKKNLLDDLKGLDFQLIKKLFAERDEETHLDYNPAPFIRIPKTEDEKKKYEEAKKIGEDHIKAGKVAAFVVAGGQGSRLGFDGPKGKFPVGPITNKSLFQIHAEKIYKYCEKYNTNIPFLIMTSEANHDETIEYFKEKNYFGLDDRTVMIFSQNMIPSIDSTGNLILMDKLSIFKNPDGHGGSLTALHTTGVLEKLKELGIETISYFQVDNPLVKIVDPVFIGFHVQEKADISSKALMKAYAEEKVGVFVVFTNNRYGVVEYSDLPADKANLKNNEGELEFTAGSIAIHLFNRDFIESITSGENVTLPFHTAKKKIKAFQNGKENEIDGLKFEKFVFDALPLTEKNVIFETEREVEFAPVKNPDGVDSVESAQELMDGLYKRWLKERGIVIPDTIEIVEISPLVAVDPEDIKPSVRIPKEKKVYIE